MKITIEDNRLILEYDYTTIEDADIKDTQVHACQTADKVIDAMLKPIVELNPDAHCNDPCIYFRIDQGYDCITYSFSLTVHQ